MNKEDWTRSDAMGVVNDAAKCFEHPFEIPFTEQDIDKIIYLHLNNEDWDTDSETIFTLKNGKYVRAIEWSDSSGHG